MIKNLLVSFIALTSIINYASPSTQVNQNTISSNNNSTDSSDALTPLNAAGAVQFAQPWVRPTTNVDNVISSSAMYFTLVNTRPASYNIVNISSDEVGRIEIHQTVTDSNGVSQMVKVDYPFLISGNLNVGFIPGGMHIMLYDIRKDLNIGDTVNITFFFDDGSVKTVTAKVATDNPYNTTTSPSGS
ncbi:MAG: copper chaperone PCu(A)C [Rickettsia endosymbiont of Argas persicus]